MSKTKAKSFKPKKYTAKELAVKVVISKVYFEHLEMMAKLASELLNDWDFEEVMGLVKPEKMKAVLGLENQTWQLDAIPYPANVSETYAASPPPPNTKPAKVRGAK